MLKVYPNMALLLYNLSQPTSFAASTCLFNDSVDCSSSLVHSSPCYESVPFLLSRSPIISSAPLPSASVPTDVDQDLIVSFSTYSSVSDHESTLAALLSHLRWIVRPRHNLASEFPTDFLLLSFGDSKEKLLAMETLSKQSQIKSVVPQRLLSRNLKEERSAQTDNDFKNPQRFRTSGAFTEDLKTGSNRKILNDDQITDVLHAEYVWNKGFSGANVKVAIFDTGVSQSHPHFRFIDERTNWTDEETLDDALGHGTFVAGVIASHQECKGFAPNARLSTFRVFNSRQMSYTSWFLDAFNYAIFTKMDVLNLSIGGPDFLDRPFVDKVNEMSANNIIVVSAIGNDGPLWGTLNNPADQMDVIGVGGVQGDDMASFSSRGMTTHELPFGYGRVKPDVVTSGRITGSKIGGGCRSLSGTSVASPVVAGVVSLLASVIPEKNRKQVVNPATMKQVLIESAIPVKNPSIFEQGMGKLNLPGAFDLLYNYEPHASLVPHKLDLSACPYMWPFCHGIYETGLPLIFNATILNPMSVAGRLEGNPKWLPKDSQSDVISVEFTYPEVIWPWTGYLGIFITVKTGNRDVNRVISGTLQISVVPDSGIVSSFEVPLTVRVIPTPPREKRVLWDQFHNLRYPSGYFPRDNLEQRSDILDWNGDHPHTNYRDFYNHLHSSGYFLEVLGHDFTCFDAANYGTLLIVDAEEDYFPEEISKLHEDVSTKGLSVIIMADWFNVQTMLSINFFDDNTRSTWTPVTGGANVPALNRLLTPFGVKFGNRVFQGSVQVGNHQYDFASGNSIVEFPSGGYLHSSVLTDATKGDGASLGSIAVPFLGGLALPQSNNGTAGRLVVYGDSNCLDQNRRTGNGCEAMLDDFLAFTMADSRSNLFSDRFRLSENFVSDQIRAPDAFLGNEQMLAYSRVLKPGARPYCFAGTPKEPHVDVYLSQRKAAKEPPSVHNGSGKQTSQLPGQNLYTFNWTLFALPLFLILMLFMFRRVVSRLRRQKSLVNSPIQNTKLRVPV